ncbi:MFS transporter [Marisediminitalea sp.]|uniref:MFS transporter n=1 Tax=Marisediminitalea sp. TaxID=2662268 RepID=UPI0026A148FA
MRNSGQSNPKFAMWFVLVSVFLDAMGHGLLAPIIPDLIRELAGVDISGAALYGGAIIALFATIQFFATPLLGALSDAYGRRPVLLVSFTAFGINYLLMGFAPSIEWLFLAQALAGLFGATPAVAGAFIADITPKENRAKRYGSLGAAFGLGFMFGPVLSGLLAEYGLRTPIFVAALLTLSNAVLGFFVFRESLAQYLRRPFKLVNASPWGVFMQLRVNKQIPRLLLVVLCLHIALNTVPTVWPYFTAFQFQWTPREIGLSMGMYGIVSIIAQGFAVGRISQRFGDLVASLTGMLGLLIGSIAFAVISDLYWLLPFIIPSAMGFMTNAGLMSYMSAHTDPSSQGTLQGAFAATRSVGAIITPLTLPWLFHLFTTPNNAYPVYPGIPFVIASLLAACAILLLLRANRLAHSQA